jgi:predicted metal-dependent HD superfamily phosphohydrolase
MNKITKKAENILKEAISIARTYGFDITVEWVLKHWNGPNRFWHTPEHLFNMLVGIKELKDNHICKENEYNILVISALFHDIIYDTKKEDNEEKSVDLMLSTINNQIVDNSVHISEKRIKEDIDKIIHIILATKIHNNNDEICKKFNDLDTNILDARFIDMLDWENKIRQEYKWIEHKEYKKKRIKFLLGQIKSHPDNTVNIKKLINYINSERITTNSRFSCFIKKFY